MFGLFKKQIALGEFGEAIIHLAKEPLSSECSRALGMSFENFDASQGWSRFLERQGVSIAKQKLHFRLWTQCAIQGTCTQFNEGQSRAITESAMNTFSEKIPEYSVAAIYPMLEAVYAGGYTFAPLVAGLSNREASINYLPNPRVGVLNAKYLIEAFVLTRMENRMAFIDGFRSYCSTACASIGTVSMAVNHILTKFKI